MAAASNSKSPDFRRSSDCPFAPTRIGCAARRSGRGAISKPTIRSCDTTDSGPVAWPRTSCRPSMSVTLPSAGRPSSFMKAMRTPSWMRCRTQDVSAVACLTGPELTHTTTPA